MHSRLFLVLAALVMPSCSRYCPDFRGSPYDTSASSRDTADTDDTAIYVPDIQPVRRLLLENFTNLACGPCAGKNPRVDAFLDAVGTGNVIGLKVHTDWPTASDPYFVAAPEDNEIRWDYYEVTSVPDDYIDGVFELEWGSDDLIPEIGILYARPPEVDLDVTLTAGPPPAWDVSITVTGSDLLTEPRDVVLRAMPLIRHLTLEDEAPNGETEANDGVIAHLPDANGTALTVSAGSEQTVLLSFDLPADWDSAELEVVAFVQDDLSQDVLQAATSEPPPTHSYRFIEDEADAVILDDGETATFTVKLQNSGAADTVDVRMLGDLPSAWQSTWSIKGEDVSGTLATVDMAPGEVVEITVTLDPDGHGGWTPLILSADPHDEGLDDTASEARFLTRVLTYGSDVLLVDHDGGEDYETYYQASLDAAGVSTAIWSSGSDLSAIDLSRFQTVVWNGGWHFPHFAEGEQEALTAYLDGGGQLFISGQDIGWDQCDPGSWYSDSVAWYEATLHATYLADDTSLLLVEGLSGDPISDGFAFEIDGGTGASNQAFPSDIAPIGPGAELILRYDTTHGAGVRATHESGRVVYLAFGFEGIADDVSRDQLMSNSLTWLDAR